MVMPVGDQGLAISTKGLTKHFDDLVAVDGLDLEVPQGICFGLLGPNGAGKTTTIRMLQCLMPPSSGSIQVLGIDGLAKGRAVRQRIGVLSQYDMLDPDFTTRHNLIAHARFFNVPRDVASQRADELIEFVGLTQKRDVLVEHLSGGMRRRLAVARSLISDPELLILDEPTTGLDPQARQMIWAKIRGLLKNGRTVLLTTHYMDEAELLCDEIVIVDKGTVLARGTPAGLISEHVGKEVIEFIPLIDDYDQLDEILAGVTGHITDLGHKAETYGERVIAFSDDVEGMAEQVSSAFELRDAIVRRASLEDVFLRLTGRGLRD